MAFFRQPPEYFADWTYERRMLVFEMANTHPSPEEIRAAYRRQQQLETKTIKDEETKKLASEEYGIDVEALNKLIEGGELDV